MEWLDLRLRVNKKESLEMWKDAWSDRALKMRREESRKEQMLEVNLLSLREATKWFEESAVEEMAVVLWKGYVKVLLGARN